jgi:ribosome-associated protein
MLRVTPQINIPRHKIRISYSRSGGPGGQNVNKLNTKATLRWAVQSSPSVPEAVRNRFTAKYANKITVEGELVISSQRFREAGGNMTDCLEKLRRMLLSVAKPPKPRRATKPSRGSIERRLESKRHRSSCKSQRRVKGEE